MPTTTYYLVVLLVIATAAVSATPTTPKIVDVSGADESFFCSASYTTKKLYTCPAGTELCCKKNNAGSDVAKGVYRDGSSTEGWDFLSIQTILGNGLEPAQAGGFIEGYLTAKKIALMYVPRASPAAQRWITEHINFMNTTSQKRQRNGVYGRSTQAMQMMFAQMQGIADGFNAAGSAGNRTMTFMDVFLINFGDEIGNVENAVRYQAGHNVDLMGKSFQSHCSAIVKNTGNDLFMAHDTWDIFQGMTWRMYKVYDFSATYVVNPKIAFSAHPAFIASGDDWYAIPKAGLGIQETTNGIMNSSLLKYVVPQTISEFIRTMAANYVATDGEVWTQVFSWYNSGTYNNQYMVVNFNLFVPGSSIVPGTLWIAEQIPGFVYRADVSDKLKSDGYWASYNIPYSEYIYNVSGYRQKFEEQGDFWSYTKYARPEIFRRNQSDITDIDGVQRLMRYNNYKVDPFSAISNCTAATNGVCSPSQSSMLSIASRGDLMPVFPTNAEMVAHYGVAAEFMAQGCFGAIDSKVMSYSVENQWGRIISGPTSDQQPVFSWGVGVCPSAPPSSPTEVNFPWVQFTGF